jgi:hypothetical protein
MDNAATAKNSVRTELLIQPNSRPRLFFLLWPDNVFYPAFIATIFRTSILRPYPYRENLSSPIPQRSV